ncbi:uncharacterized protein LOC116845752 [Odontomachus brunneus]|uniref:uncharacterized protein LOC116845752 n=1 Tax=Odontomachus brunneus TaxID=486640 RepID=UPI0013F18BFD|nr:uncharacterized protein LOC116845752 [Odontomachus brunneus]
MSEKRAGNITAGQKEMLLEYLSVHPELISAKFTSKFSYKDAQILWNEITHKLNALPGAKKTWYQWRKAWHDMKTKVKGKKTNINKNLKKTGGGPQSESSMTSIDNNVTRNKSQQFDKTLPYKKYLSGNIQSDLELQKQYYHKKIQLMERDVIAKERIAAAIERFCAISNQTDNLNYEEVEYLDEIKSS